MNNYKLNFLKYIPLLYVQIKKNRKIKDITKIKFLFNYINFNKSNNNNNIKTSWFTTYLKKKKNNKKIFGKNINKFIIQYK